MLQFAFGNAMTKLYVSLREETRTEGDATVYTLDWSISGVDNSDPMIVEVSTLGYITEPFEEDYAEDVVSHDAPAIAEADNIAAIFEIAKWHLIGEAVTEGSIAIDANPEWAVKFDDDPESHQED